MSSAVKTPVVAAIEYNYERDGEIVIPAGSKAFGELSQANEQGYVGIQFHTIQIPDRTIQKIEGHAVGLQFQPLRGHVTGRNTGKKFLVRSLTGVGTILAAVFGVQSGTGLASTLSNNVLLRERVADNVAVAGEQQLNDLAYHQNIVVTVPGNTRPLYRAGETQRARDNAWGSGSHRQPWRCSGLCCRFDSKRPRASGAHGTEAGVDANVPTTTEYAGGADLIGSTIDAFRNKIENALRRSLKWD